MIGRQISSGVLSLIFDFDGIVEDEERRGEEMREGEEDFED